MTADKTDHFDAAADETMITRWVIAMATIGLMVIAFSIFGGWQRTPLLEDFVLGHAMDLVGVLFFVTLLQERALEVLVSTTRGPKARAMKLVISKHEGELATLKKRLANAGSETKREEIEAEITNVTKTLQKQTADRSKQRSGTMKFAFGASWALGILISAVGIRVLASMFNQGSLDQGLQNSWFTFTDILVTGALIAGGSEGIHKVTSLLTTFLESQTEQQRKREVPTT